MKEEEYQLEFWPDTYGSNEIIFRVTYCREGCPLNKVYRATTKDSYLYLQNFNGDGGLQEPQKWLLTLERMHPRYESERYMYYIEDDWTLAFSRITHLTDKTPKFRLDEAQADRPSSLGH